MVLVAQVLSCPAWYPKLDPFDEHRLRLGCREQDAWHPPLDSHGTHTLSKLDLVPDQGHTSTRSRSNSCHKGSVCQYVPHVPPRSTLAHSPNQWHLPSKFHPVAARAISFWQKDSRSSRSMEKENFSLAVVSVELLFLDSDQETLWT